MSSPSPAASSTAAPPGVPLLDLGRQYAVIQQQILAAVARVCASGRFVLGPDCQELERNVATYCGAAEAIACASGSDALLLALMAVDIGPGDEVLCPSYTFFATASAVTRLGARPVFVDIEPSTFNLDPRHAAACVTAATKAIIPVHLFGQCAEMDAIRSLAATHKLAVIEDAAQAIGAEYRGTRAGSLGDMACLSFYPTKNLGGFGDGGMLTTSDARLAARLRLFRAHGMEPRYYHHVIGINSRLDTLQAAVLNVKLPYLESWTQQRITNAARYTELFREAKLDRVVGLPATAAGRRHVWNQYTLRIPDGRRDALRAHLASRNIGTEIYYPLGLHQQACFAYLGYREGSLPETERATRETIALPIFPELTAGEQATVVGAIADFFSLPAATARQSVARPKFLDRKTGARHDA